MSSRQVGTWPQLIGYALFEIWSLILDGELKNRIGYLAGRLSVVVIRPMSPASSLSSFVTDSTDEIRSSL